MFKAKRKWQIFKTTSEMLSLFRFQSNATSVIHNNHHNFLQHCYSLFKRLLPFSSSLVLEYRPVASLWVWWLTTDCKQLSAARPNKSTSCCALYYPDFVCVFFTFPNFITLSSTGLDTIAVVSQKCWC